MKKAIIIGNGAIKNYSYYARYFQKESLIVCVDGGARHINGLGIKPHVLMGDFDSITPKDFEELKSKGTKILSFPRHKEMTDTELAMNFAIENGCNTIIFIGCVGTRLDHSLANVFLLIQLLGKGIRGIVVDEQNEIALIDQSITLQGEPEKKVTLLPMTKQVEGVTTTGLSYPLRDETLEMGSSRGVSNEFCEDIATISIKKGRLLVIQSKD